jgi:hypothetical protein
LAHFPSSFVPQTIYIFHYTALPLRSEYGNIICLRNIGNDNRNQTAPKPKTSSPLY